MAEITGNISEVRRISGSISGGASISGGLSAKSYIMPPTYSGPCEVAPAQEAQILHTNGYLVDNDIIVDPVPDC